MKRTEVFMSLVVVTALTLTACDAPKSCCAPAESMFETTVTLLTDESGTTPSVSVTPTATPATVSATSSSTSESDGTDATTSEGSTGSESTSSGSGSEGSSSSGGSGSSSSGSGSSGSGSSSSATGTPVPTETSSERPVTPTETTTSSTYVKGVHCGDCGQETLVENTQYRYTTPEQSHTETNPTWDYGVQHCEVQINWKSNAKELGDPPSITISFDRKVDTSGMPYDNNAENDATSQAMDKADEWLKAQGVENCSGYYSWQTNKGSTDYVNYQENAYTVIDEPEHEYECTAYICDSCGAVEIAPGTEKQIR